MLIAGATAYSYWVLTSNLDREDDEFVASRVKDVESRLRDGGRSATCGHGLGLSTAKSIVELHGGRAAVYSRPDHGTNVETYWPINASGGQQTEMASLH